MTKKSNLEEVSDAADGLEDFFLSMADVCKSAGKAARAFDKVQKSFERINSQPKDDPQVKRIK